MRIRQLVRRDAFGYITALVFVAVVTGVVAIVRVLADVSNVSMLYLLAVLASAVLFGSGPASVASIAAFLAYDVFFIEPRYQLTVDRTDEWVALGLLLVTGVITGQLAAALRDRAREAERREREAVVLYDVVRLINDPEVRSSLTAVAERVRMELGLSAVVVSVEGGAGGHEPFALSVESGDAADADLARAMVGLPSAILAPGKAPTARRAGTPGRWIKIVPPTARGDASMRERSHQIAIQVHGKRAGALVVVRRADAPSFRREDDRLLSHVATQLGSALERIQLRDEATQAEILRRTDELKTALLNAVSHDLRTPLASILASAGSLLQEDVQWSESEKRDFARAIEEEAQRLNRLVGNLLDLSRIEAGSMRPDKGWYDLGALIDGVAGRLRGVIGEHPLILTVPDDLPPIFLDYVEVDQVLSNLVENAAKYTPDRAEISILARRLGEELEVEVADRGPGIREDDLPHLFDAFYRAARPDQPRGTGLGLAVARGLIEAHGGRIRAENRLDGGARFVFSLPISPVDAVAVTGVQA